MELSEIENVNKPTMQCLWKISCLRTNSSGQNTRYCSLDRVVFTTKTPAADASR